MGRKVIISSDRLNSYGTRVLTAGLDIEQYVRNPVLLWMHERGNVIGYVDNLSKDGGYLSGELVFDDASELSERLHKQFDFGSLKMVSAGLDILETSDSRELLVDGQTSPTITRSKLFEVSLVDIGANDDAIVLKRGGRTVTLGRDSACPMPLLDNTNSNNSNNMENKTIALELGLNENATEAEISAALAELAGAKAEIATLHKEKEALQLERIEALVDSAISDRRLSEGKKDEFVALGRKIGSSELKSVLAAMQPQAKLSQLIRGGEQTAAWTKLSEVPASQLMQLRKDNPQEYGQLYKAEYGIDLPEY